MPTKYLAALLPLALAAPLAAQQPPQQPQPADSARQMQHSPALHAEHAGRFPAGWQLRTDRDQPADSVMFMEMGEGFHVVTGPAAVLFHPEWTHQGDYRVAARLTQNRAPRHPEAYGLVIGGRQLDAPGQRYTYFLVRGTGEYFLATRRGAERIKHADWTAHPAVPKADAQGRASQVLAAEVRGDEVVFSIDGTEVARRPRAELEAEGVFGFRVNHNLDVGIAEVQR